MARMSSDAHTRCVDMLRISLERNPRAKTLIRALNGRGCLTTALFFHCVDCSTHNPLEFGSEPVQQGGGYIPGAGIRICEEVLQSQKHMDETLAHELIHAFDDCRAQLDFANCDHHACTEVRAANLSGDCRFMNEMFRMKFGLKAQHQTCVKRRATLSLLSNPNCNASKEQAAAAVDRVFPKCFRDWAPFSNIPT